MSPHRPVPLDAAAEIRDLDKQGYGRNRISAMTGISASAVRSILTGVHRSYSEKLTARQIQQLINRGFGNGRQNS